MVEVNKHFVGIFLITSSIVLFVGIFLFSHLFLKAILLILSFVTGILGILFLAQSEYLEAINKGGKKK